MAGNGLQFVWRVTHGTRVSVTQINFPLLLIFLSPFVIFGVPEIDGDAGDAAIFHSNKFNK